MGIRLGTVTSVYPETGKIKVAYEDRHSSSLPLAMLSMNREVSMPKVGERVLTLHMDNGSSKGFVLGTYYGGGGTPKAAKGYRKDFDETAYATSKDGDYLLYAGSITLKANDIVFQSHFGDITLEELLERLERIEDALLLPRGI